MFDANQNANDQKRKHRAMENPVVAIGMVSKMVQADAGD